MSFRRQWALVSVAFLACLVTFGCGLGTPSSQPPTPSPNPTETVAQPTFTALPTFTAMSPTATPQPVSPTATERPPLPTIRALSPTSTMVPPTATPLATPVPSPTLPPTGGRVEGFLPQHNNLPFTLCDSYHLDDLRQGAQAAECDGAVKQMVTADDGGSFVFTSIPAGEYYLLVDIPEARKDNVPPPCPASAYVQYGPTAGGVRVMCLSEVLGPSIVVSAGQTTTWGPFGNTP